MRRTNVIHALLTIGLVGGSALLTSCAASTKPAKVEAEAPVDPHLVDDEQVERQVQEHAQRVRAAMAERGAMANREPEPIVPQVDWLDGRGASSIANASIAAPAVSSTLPPASADAGPQQIASTPEPSPQPQVHETPAVMSVQSAPTREDLAAQLLGAIRQGDDPAVVKALAAAALSIVQRQATLDPTDLAELDAAQKRAVRQYHAMLSELAQRVASGEELDSSSLLNYLQSAADAGPIGIRKIVLCRNVRSYGVYEPFDSQTFLAGREQPMIVYVELDQFQADKQDDGQLEVRLQQEIELYNEADGLAVWRQPAVEIVDRSRNRRRDFFVVQLVRLPARLSVGKYLLKIRVTDKHGGSIDETTVPIHLVADQSLVKQ